MLVIYHNWHYDFIKHWLTGGLPLTHAIMQIMSDATDLSLIIMIDCGRLCLYSTFIRLVAILTSCIVQTFFADAAIVNLRFQDLVSINVHCLWKFCRRIVEDVENMATMVAIKMFVRTNATIIAHMVLVDGYHLRQILFGKHS